MGLFKRKSLKTVDMNSRMMQLYPNFYEYFKLSKGMIQGELSQSDDTILEFRFPILTFGNVMGYIYHGIEFKPSNSNLYMYAVSKRGDKTKKRYISIERDYEVEIYYDVNKDLQIGLMSDPNFMIISTGGRY